MNKGRPKHGARHQLEAQARQVHVDTSLALFDVALFWNAAMHRRFAVTVAQPEDVVALCAAFASSAHGADQRAVVSTT